MSGLLTYLPGLALNPARSQTRKAPNAIALCSSAPRGDCLDPAESQCAALSSAKSRRLWRPGAEPLCGIRHAASVSPGCGQSLRIDAQRVGEMPQRLPGIWAIARRGEPHRHKPLRHSSFGRMLPLVSAGAYSGTRGMTAPLRGPARCDGRAVPLRVFRAISGRRDGGADAGGAAMPVIQAGAIGGISDRATSGVVGGHVRSIEGAA